MGKRVFWFAVGVGLTAVVVLKGKELFERFTPKGVADQVGRAQRSLAKGVGDFLENLSQAMEEREAEIKEAIDWSDEPAGQ
ncbi:MAG: hypothetical protein LBR32_06240 [Propionibacteriaceae bacterium]|jgi:hypothetical protein|nr:hypothetical protein [Propionibacteriaceae bacterium]